MPGPVLSERDLAVLRSFARRIDPSDAGAHNNLGVLYYQKGLIEDATAEFVRALELDPKMQVAQSNLDIAYRESGHYDRRITQLREAVRRHPEDREARWELGRAHAALGRHADAIAEFQALLAWQPHDVPAMLQLGLAEKARGNLDTASDWLSRACAEDPASAVARFYYGEVLYNRGLNEPALQALREAIARNPDYAEAHYLLAFVYGDIGRHEEAREATKQAIKLNPTLARAQANLALERYAPAGAPAAAQRTGARPQIIEGRALAHYNLGLAFRQKGLLEEALREYGVALEAGEDRRMTLQAMAEVRLLRRELPLALELYDALVREHADSPKLWNERGVCLHQAGRRAEAIASYERAVAVDPGYQLAWNNLGVARAGEPPEAAVESFRRALAGDRPLFAARLNLGLLYLQRHQLRHALEEYQTALGEQSGSGVAWNGVGLVLMELRRFEDARNAFGRAVDADPGMAGAHYNLSFVLSQLGDFDGALRETRRALELEPLYVPQKFSLTIDLQYEDPTIAIAPELTAEVGGEQLAGEFAFDPPALDQLFAELTPAVPAVNGNGAVGDALDLARDYIAKGLLDLASAELSRAAARGAPQGATAVLLGDIFAKRGLYGEALERYRAARSATPDDPDATLGEIRALLALGWAGDAAPLADALAHQVRGDVEVLVARARVRLAVNDALGALDCIREAQTLEPGRPDLFHLHAQVSARLGDRSAALAAFNAALQLDPSLVRVWFELGGIEEERGNTAAARAAYERALDLLPTYSAAAIALADLVRRSESPRAAVGVLIRLLEADPYELEALTALGRALLEDGRTTQALEAFERVLRFDPEHAGALYYEGAALARQRQFDQAVQAWERVVQIDPAGPYASQARTRARSARDLQHIFAASVG
jgi:tetratricopeptide (TPR) repeat protein